MLMFFAGLAVGLPIGGALMWVYGLRLKAEAQKVETAVTSFKGNKQSNK